jgi:asparagine synthase (glutamine-hydrolysing)
MKALGMTETDPVKRYANLVMHETDGEMQDVWDGPPIGDPTEYLRSAFERADGPTRLDRLMHVDFLTYLPDDLLVKVDRASMAHSLEVRSPFLDHEFIRFSSAIPAKYKWKNGKRKYILKKSFNKELPSKILNRNKEGFSVPIAKWFRNELREFARENLEELSKRESFESFGLERMLEEHVSKEKDHARQIWDLVQLNIWYETFIE